MPRTLSLVAVEDIRRTSGRSLLLFLTDRCPVGCAHCSVDSRRDSPTIVDFDHFKRLVAGICALRDVELVGISGGEPFVERRGLIHAVDRFSGAGKLLLIYTSGAWATSFIPGWIRPVIREASCVFLSTDGYHAAMLPNDRFVRAARTIREEGVGLVVQVIRMPHMVEGAKKLLQQAFGEDWSLETELSLTPPLPYGRGASVFHLRSQMLGRGFGPCSALAAPVVRYDGKVTACCNEQVITGHGPCRLRSQCSDEQELKSALHRWSSDPLLGIIGTLGPGPLTEHHRLRDMRDERFTSICDLCWKMLGRISMEESRDDKVLKSIAALTRTGSWH